MGFGSWFTTSRNQNIQETAVRQQASTMSQPRGSSEKTVRVETSERGRAHAADVVRPRSAHQSKNRRSWFGGREDEKTEVLPPMPPMPTAVPTPQNTSASTDRPRSVASSKSIKRSHSTKRTSFWTSSNPDESDSGVDVPPVPALSRGQSKESVNTLSHAEQKPAPIQRRKYVPRSAAKSFLATTSGATEDKRKSYRRSFKLEDNEDLVCLTEEQQIEWAKLMDARGRLPTPVSNSSVKAPVDGRSKYSDSQALAALESGVAR